MLSKNGRFSPRWRTRCSITLIQTAGSASGLSVLAAGSGGRLAGAGLSGWEFAVLPARVGRLLRRVS